MIENILTASLAAAHDPEWDDDQREDFDLGTREAYGDILVAEIKEQIRNGKEEAAIVAEIGSTIRKFREDRQFVDSRAGMRGPGVMRHRFGADRHRR